LRETSDGLDNEGTGRRRSIFEREGYDGLRQALARGEALPSIVTTLAIGSLLSGNSEPGAEAERFAP
jgi:hypothetical protein